MTVLLVKRNVIIFTLTLILNL